MLRYSKVVKIGLKRNLIVGGLVAILGCSREDQAENSTKQEKPSAPVQKKQAKPDQPWPPFPLIEEPKPNYQNVNTTKRVSTQTVYFYDTKLVKTSNSLPIDDQLSDICQKYGYDLFMIASNQDATKKQFNLTNKSMILVNNYDEKTKIITELERFPVENKDQTASRLEKELQYHVQKKGTPPVGCKDYKKD